MPILWCFETEQIFVNSVIMSAFIKYAFNEQKELVHVDSVPNGKNCGCSCPRCDALLEAKNKGMRRKHHFAHSKGNEECKGAYETTLHLLAKKVIQEVDGIMLPESNTSGFPSGFTPLKNIEVEKFDSKYNFRPDAEGIMPNGKRLIIEFLVTHKVSPVKYQSIIDNNLYCVEIDLNWLELDENIIKNYLVNNSEGRKWIEKYSRQESNNCFSSYKRNPLYDIAKNTLKDTFERNDIIIRVNESENEYSLRKYKYNKCVADTEFRGFKSDLLLYRTERDNKGYISINFRGRRRNDDARFPDDLRIIDVIIRDMSEDRVKEIFEKGVLCDGVNNVHFSGKGWNKLGINTRRHQNTINTGEATVNDDTPANHNTPQIVESSNNSGDDYDRRVSNFMRFSKMGGSDL